MVLRILESSVSSDSSVNFMCNNMGFMKNLLSSDFGGHLFIFGLYNIKVKFYDTESRPNRVSSDG